MDIVYRIDVEKDGVRQGSGPIKSASSWTSETRLGESGEFTCTIAATDDQILQVKPYNTLVCRVLIQGVGYVEVGRGEIRDIKTTVDPDGRSMIEASGPDQANRLAERSVGYLEVGVVSAKNPDGTNNTDAIGTPIKLKAAIDLLQVEWNKRSSDPGFTAWTFDHSAISAGSIYDADVFFQFAGETFLAALAKLADMADVHFIVGPGNVAAFRPNSDFLDCGSRAIATPSRPEPLDPYTCYIVGTPSVSEETRDTYTRILAYGYGKGENSIGLHYLVDSNPDVLDPLPAIEAGYAFVMDDINPLLPVGIKNIVVEDPANNDPNSPNYNLGIGRILERFKKYQDIEQVLPDDFDKNKPNTNPPAPIYTDDEKKKIRQRANKSAAQALLKVAMSDLKESLNRTIHYDLSLLHLDKLVKPGQSIRCVFSYRLGTGWTKVNERLNITAVRLTVDSNGIRATDLTVSTVTRPPRLDADPLLRLYAWQQRG